MLAEASKESDSLKNNYSAESDDEEFSAIKAKIREEMKRGNTNNDKLEEMAREWAKREFYKQSLKQGRMPISEEQYIDLVWDRAMFEADLKLRTMEGKSVNESEERKKFKEDQAKKKAAAFEKAKERFKNMMLEDIERDDTPTGNILFRD